MTQHELLANLHQYTQWEALHMQNPANIGNMEKLNCSMGFPVSESDKTSGLHLPHIPDKADNTFSETLFFQKASGQDIQIVQHDRYTPPRLHKHDFYELVYVYEGEFIQQITAQKFLMHTGDFCLVPPEVCHSLDVHNYSVILNILVTKSRFNEIILNGLQGSSLLLDLFLGDVSAKPARDYILFHTNGDPEIQQIILNLCLEMINKEPYYLHMMHADILLLFGLLLRHFETTCEIPAPNQQKYDQNLYILQYIDKNYQTVTLQKLADVFHYSPQYMSCHIKQLTGMSFTTYLLQKRMQAASDMLIKTSLKIKSISEATGYQSQEHFNRVFHKYYGISPGAYRNSHQEPR